MSSDDSVRRHHRWFGVPSNLPAGPSSFVGRGADLTRVGELLAATRLLTLTGAGGCGKTRLARQAAAGAADGCPHGVWWVELAALADDGLVGDAVARELGLPLEGRPATDVVVEHLDDSAALLVLDNCEHVVDAVAEFVDRLLRGTSTVRVLATSRQPLDVEGETTWRVPSMSVPPPTVDRDGLGRFDASRLFLERCAQASPGTIPGDDDVGRIARICERLDGIPLALELAAARTRTMTLERILHELDDRFRLLTGGPRQALARHRTLRASAEWSFDLLDEPERVLLRRLAIFVGGFDAQGAVTVAGSDPLRGDAVLDLLGRLVDRSLVQFDPARDRYRLLETIREYGREQLARAGEQDGVADRHLGWACAFAENHDPAMTRADPGALDAVEAELPNLRVALDHATTSPSTSADAGLRLVTALPFFWAQRGLGLEGAERAVRVLDAHPDAPAVLRGRAWAATAYARFYGGDFENADEDAARGLAEATIADDGRGQARCRHVQGAVALLIDPPTARTALAEATGLARSCGDRWCETDALQMLAFSHFIQHHVAPAQEPLMRSAQMAEADGNTFQLAWHQLGLAMTSAAAGRLADAQDAARRGADEAKRIGDPAVEMWARATEVVAAMGRRRFGDLADIAAGAAPDARTGSPILHAFAEPVRRIAGESQEDGVSALVEVAELLRTTFAPGEGLRLALVGAAGALALGDHERARTLAEGTLTHATQLGSALVGPCRILLARVHRRDGDPVGADRLAHDGLVTILDAQLVVDLPDALETVAGAAVDLDHPAPAARLLAAATTLRATLDLPGPFPTDADADRVRLTASLGEDFTARWTEGTTMDAHAATAYARRARGERRRPISGWDALTSAELEVARLAADGLSNPQIGARLFVARGTVKTHLEHVYAKLGLHNRAELAASYSRRARP